MDNKKKEVSGWYSQKAQTPEERAAEMRQVEAWYEKKNRLNYRTVPLEIPGKMMLALGRLAQEKGVNFSEFIEGILGDYLRTPPNGKGKR
jgi:hypothetical protein